MLSFFDRTAEPTEALGGPEPKVLVAANDTRAAKICPTLCGTIFASIAENVAEFRDEKGVKIPEHEVFLNAVGRVASSAEGLKAMEALDAIWLETFGEAAPGVYQLPSGADRDTQISFLGWFAGQLARQRSQAARRTTMLMRELAVLRHEHDEMQDNFRHLESFVFECGPNQRTLNTSFPPNAELLSLNLKCGDQLMQRLTGSSVGLCDVAVHISAKDKTAKGVLHASLFSPDTQDTVAIWEVPTAELDAGWVRFSLERALGPDPVSLILSLNYEGKGEIKISRSVDHPEERFSPTINGISVAGLPAFQIWKWVSGARAPIGAKSIAVVGSRSRLRHVGPDILSTAIDVNSPDTSLSVDVQANALIVHVLEEREACAMLPGLALPGAKHIFAEIRTRHPSGPAVEYRLGVEPRNARTRESGAPRKFEPEQCSPWIRAEADQTEQVHLLFPAPLSEVCDIYLFTRLANGETSAAFGWSSFANIRLQY